MSAIEEVNRENTEVLKKLLEYIFKRVKEYQGIQQIKKMEANIDKLEKDNPAKIRNADIEKTQVDTFIEKSQKEGITAIKIIEGKEMDTLKYSVDDEHRISDIFKEMEEEINGNIESDLYKDEELDLERIFSKIDIAKMKNELEKITGKEISKTDLETVMENMRLESNVETKKDKRISINDIGKMTKTEISEVVKQKDEKEINGEKESKLKDSLER